MEVKIEENKDQEAISWNQKEILLHLKNIVTPDKLDILTFRKVREELEKSLKLPPESLKSKKPEINEILDNLISEMQNSEKLVKETFANDENAHNDRKKIELTLENEDNLVKTAEKISTKRKQASMMSIEEFLEKAETLNLTINNSKLELAVSPRQFSTGSVGWYFGDKIPLPIGDDTEVICQVSINCTVVGSKSWSQRPNKKVRK